MTITSTTHVASPADLDIQSIIAPISVKLNAETATESLDKPAMTETSITVTAVPQVAY